MVSPKEPPTVARGSDQQILPPMSNPTAQPTATRGSTNRLPPTARKSFPTTNETLIPHCGQRERSSHGGPGQRPANPAPHEQLHRSTHGIQRQHRLAATDGPWTFPTPNETQYPGLLPPVSEIRGNKSRVRPTVSSDHKLFTVVRGSNHKLPPTSNHNARSHREQQPPDSHCGPGQRLQAAPHEQPQR